MTTAAREPARMRVRTAALWAMAGQYSAFAIQLAVTIVISRYYLTPGEVGLFSIALAAALLAAILQDFGLTRYIGGLPSIDAATIARCGTVSLLFSFAVAGAIALAAWPMAIAYGQPALQPILLIIAASYLFVPLAVVPMALMSRTMSFDGHFAVNVGGAIAQGAVAILLAMEGFSSFALAWATLANGIARGIIAQAIRPALPLPPRLDGIAPILREGTKLSTLYLTGALGTRTPDLIVGKLLGLVAVGLYSRAVSLSDQFRLLISGAIGSVFYPAFARLRDSGQPLGPAYLRVAGGYTAVVWPGMAGLALASEPIVRLLFGERWIGVAPLLAAMALTEIMLIALPLVSDLPVLMGRTATLIRYSLIDTALSLGLLMLGCQWGVEGAAASRLVYGACWLALYGGLMHSLARFDAKKLIGIYARGAVVTLAAIAPLAMVYALWVPPSALGFAGLLGAAAAGGAAWLAALALVRHPALPDLLALAAALPIARRFVRKAAAS